MDDFENIMLDRIERLEIMVEALLTLRPMASVAEARDKYGSPKVRFDVKSYRGRSCKGLPLKECPPDFLEQYATALESIAVKEDAEGRTYKGKPASTYTRLDAKRARRWALMKRLGDENDSEPEQQKPAFGNGAPSGLGGGSGFSSSGFGAGGGFGATDTNGVPGSDLDDDDEAPLPTGGGDLDDVEDEIPF